MSKLKANDVKVGMVFKVTSDSESLGMDPSHRVIENTSIFIPVGTDIEIVKSAYRDVSQRVDWRVLGTKKVYTSHWITFKKNTNLVI